MVGIDRYTVLMLHCQGANGSTSFPDSSFVNPKTVTAEGDVVTSTSEATLGQISSAYFDGSAYLAIPASDDFRFETGDFTIDTWVYPTSLSGYETIVDTLFSGGSGDRTDSFVLFLNGNSFVFYLNANWSATASANLTINAWNHIAVVRANGVMQVYTNGILALTFGYSTEVTSGGLSIGISSDHRNDPFIGYMQEFRISKGIARWTTNFTPPTVPYSVGYVGGSAGTQHSLLLRGGDGVVFAAGDNTYGQLGDGTNTQQDAFEQITGLSNITALAAGGYHSLALDSSGNVWATGYNNHGQLGLGNTNNYNVWTQITALSNIVAIAAGEYHSLAVDSSGNTWAWGYDSSGQLGDGLAADRSTPYQVTT
jgi:hypothetical protein